jgi:L-glyceraldehyde 3-phosphate reductase
VLDEHGLGSIAFTVLAQGLLSNRFLGDEPVARATDRPSFDDRLVNDDNRERLRGLAAVAEKRGQTLAQMALAWVLRPGGVTSALIGVSSVEQLDENLKAAENTDFTDDELAEIDRWAGDADGVDLWAVSADI